MKDNIIYVKHDYKALSKPKKIFDKIMNAFINDEKVIIKFEYKDPSIWNTNFFNEAIAPLYRMYPEAKIKDNLVIEGLDAYDRQLLRVAIGIIKDTIKIDAVEAEQKFNKKSKAPKSVKYIKQLINEGKYCCVNCNNLRILKKTKCYVCDINAETVSKSKINNFFCNCYE